MARRRPSKLPAPKARDRSAPSVVQFWQEHALVHWALTAMGATPAPPPEKPKRLPDEVVAAGEIAAFRAQLKALAPAALATTAASTKPRVVPLDIVRQHLVDHPDVNVSVRARMLSPQLGRTVDRRTLRRALEDLRQDQPEPSP